MFPQGCETDLADRGGPLATESIASEGSETPPGALQSTDANGSGPTLDVQWSCAAQSRGTMTETDSADVQPSAASKENTPSLGGLPSSASPYQLTVKRGFLALGIMFGSQILIGLGYSFIAALIGGASGGAGPVDKNTVGLVSVLGGSTITLIWIWFDLRRFGSTFGPQIGLRPSRFDVGPTVLLVLATFVSVNRPGFPRHFVDSNCNSSRT